MSEQRKIVAEYHTIVYSDGTIEQIPIVGENSPKKEEKTPPNDTNTKKLGQVLMFLKLVREKFTQEVITLYQADIVKMSPILSDCIKEVANAYNVSYSNIQDRLCRSMGLKMPNWKDIIEHWLIGKDDTELYTLLTERVASSRESSRQHDIDMIDEFFRSE